MFLKHAFLYSATNLISQGINFIEHFFLRHILPPELMGGWNRMMVIRSYMVPINLGLMYGAFRELPMLKGSNDSEAEFRYRSVTFTYSLAEALLLGFGVCFYAFWMREKLSSIEFYAILIAGGSLIPCRLQEIYVCFFQSSQVYSSLSFIMLAGNLIYSAALPIGAWLFGVQGLLWATLLSEIARTALFTFYSGSKGIKIHLLWDKKIWKNLASFGLIYKIADYPMSFFMALDLLWVTKMCDLWSLGIYAFAKAFGAGAADITVRMGAVLYTRTLTQFGSNVHREKIADDIRRFLQFQMMVSVPLICWMVVSAVPLLIRQLIPTYVDAIPLLPMVLLVIFFTPNNTNLFTTWIAEKRFLPFGLSNAFGTLSIGASLAVAWYVMGHKSLMDVAKANVVGYVLYFAYMMMTAGKHLWGSAGSVKLCLQVLFSAAWSLGAMTWLGDNQTLSLPWRQDLVESTLSSLRMLVALLPVLAAGLWLSEGGTYLYKAVQKTFRLRLQNG